MKRMNFLIKPASSLCNMRCGYCFYEDEAANRTTASMGVMTEETAALLIRRAYEDIDPDGAIQFTFQGGEPTVAGLDFFRSFVAMAKKDRPPRVRLEWAIQTNGLLLNDEWADFLAENHFLVGLSMDGCKELHNSMRRTRDGSDTWNAVCASARLLMKHKVDFNALCVVTRQCARHPQKAYTELKKLGIRYMQFIPCLDPIGYERNATGHALDAESYGSFLC